MEILTSAQHRILALLAALPSIRDRFWLGGATALSAFHLQHRLSMDLDFFTDRREQFRLAMEDLKTKANDEKVLLEIRRMGGTFSDIDADVGGEIVKLNFAVDTPFRFQPTIALPMGISVENPVDLACNKLSALYDRYEPKDFVDLYFIHTLMYNLDDLICWTKEKHGGMDNYMLAISFQKVTERLSPLPRMLRPVDPDDIKKTFTHYAARLMNESFPARPYRQ